MEKRNDVMVDIETLGTKDGSSIFQIAAVRFDLTTGEVFDSFNLTGDIAEYKKLRIDGSTLKWWLDTDSELLKRLLNQGVGSEYVLIKSFVEWLDLIEKPKLWGNGILFDNKKIEMKCSEYDLRYPVFYNNDRDVRTILELASLKSNVTTQDIREMVKAENEVKHDALDDCFFQIRLVTKCFNILKE